jgi:oligopeptide transport system ATP-binding protein
VTDLAGASSQGIVVDREVARVRAVDGVSLTLPGRNGLVGESGCGSDVVPGDLQATTLTSGSVRFAGRLAGRSPA